MHHHAHLGAQVRDLASELTANAGVMTDESADQGLGKNAPVGNTWMVLRTSYEQRTAWIAAKQNSWAWLHVPHWQSLAGPESTRWGSLKRQKKTFRAKTYYQADVSVRLSDDLTTPGGETNEGTFITDIPRNVLVIVIIIGGATSPLAHTGRSSNIPCLSWVFYSPCL